MANDRVLKKERIEGMSDGVVAVAITLMFLGFETSYESIRDASSSAEIWAFIVSEWPKFASYCLSFLLVGMYWLQHHVVFHYINRADRILIGINLLFLMVLALVVVAADWLVESLAHEHLAIFIFYAGTNITVSFMLLALWMWAAMGHRLVDDDLDRSTMRAIGGEILLGPAVCVLGVVTALYSVKAGTAVLLCVPAVFIWPRRADACWWKRARHRTQEFIAGSRAQLSQASLAEGSTKPTL